MPGEGGRVTPYFFIDGNQLSHLRLLFLNLVKMLFEHQPFILP